MRPVAPATSGSGAAAPGASAGATAQGAGAPPGSSPAAPAGSAVNPRHSFLGTVFDTVSSALGGRRVVTGYKADANGNLVPQTTAATPGEQWRNILSGVLTGLAAGAQMPARPGGAIGGLGAGFEAVQRQQLAKQELMRQHSAEDWQRQQQAALQKAHMALLNQQTASLAFGLQGQKFALAKEAADEFNAIAQSVAEDPNHQDLGTFSHIQDVYQKVQANPNLLGAHARGQIVMVTLVDAKTGALQGFHGWVVTPDWLGQKNAEPTTLYTVKYPAKPGELPTLVGTTVKAGGISNRDLIANNTQAFNQVFAAQLRQQQMEVQVKDLKLRLQQQRTAAAVAASEIKKNLAMAANLAPISGTDPFGNPVGGNGVGGTGGAMTRKEVDAARTKWLTSFVVPAESTEQSFEKADKAYREYRAAAAQGRQLPTGAQSMLMLSQHLATTFGTVKGSRVTKEMIQEHLGARGVGDAAVAAVQRLVNGDALSPDQWAAFHDLVAQSRNARWEAAINEAKNLGIGVTSMPRGNGNPIDPYTIKLFIDAADGNKKTAAAAAKKFGWAPPAPQPAAASGPPPNLSPIRPV